MNTGTPKVSFSVQSKNSAKSQLKHSRNPRHEDGPQHQHHDQLQPNKQFVTEFDPNKTLTHTKPTPRLIIPPKPNESRPHKKMKNIDLPNDDVSHQLQLELQNKSDPADGAEKITYGLNLRKTISTSKDQEHAAASVSPSEPVEKLKLKDAKFDLQRLPEDEGLKQFEDMPVEGFGAALLGGLGWYEGRGLGKNPKGNVEIKQFEKKSFVSDDANINLMSNKNKETDGFSVGKNTGSKGGDKKDKQVKNRSTWNEDRDNSNGDNSHVSEKRSREGEKKERKSRGSEMKESNGHKERNTWLRSHIRVRIISKGIKKGRLYLKKGEVVDVVGPTTCDISMDGTGELIQGVDQDLLETALPSRGGPVLVLYGRHKGVYGNLADIDWDRETGVVQDADTHKFLNVKLEQVAEYIGDPSYIGY